VVNIRKLCEAHLPGRYELQVIDLVNNPAAASSSQIIAAPTLVKQLPAPIRRFIGDMSNTERVLVGLDIKAHSYSGIVSE
jgi:circadian clock protein KaiB